MASSDLNVKFTHEKYSSRLEVAKALGTNLIEPLWKIIIDYRIKFAAPLPIYDTAHINFEIIHIDTIDNKNIIINDNCSKLGDAFNKLDDETIAKRTLINDMLKLCLKNIARANNLDPSDITLQNIIEGKQVDESYAFVCNYLDALRLLDKQGHFPLNEEFLAKYYAMLRGEEELMDFYRLNDNESIASKMIIARDYDNGVPAHFIEDMMNVTLDYAKNMDNPIVTRISAIIFMVNYIKPFTRYNNELAILSAKKILAETFAGRAAAYIPFEEIALDEKLFNEISKEVKKTHDFTYAYNCVAQHLEKSFLCILDRIVQVHSSALDVEIKMGDNKEEIKKEFGDLIGHDQLEKIQEAPKPRPIVKKNTVVETKVVSQTFDSNKVSEKELKERENEILESNPFIKKGQAHFYVHHCTKGHYYTIQQYKKFVGVVYETARTSMDNLALQGFYRREQIKNKFVYTPISKE